jgi:hypothetical protein
LHCSVFDQNSFTYFEIGYVAQNIQNTFNEQVGLSGGIIMCQKCLCRALIFVLIFVGHSIGAPDWTNSTGNHLWRNANNWWPQAVPASNDYPYNYQGIANYILIDSSTNAVARGCYLGLTNGQDDGRLDMTGGSFTVQDLIIGSSYADGEFNLKDGTVTVTNNLILGWLNTGKGTLNVSGGHLDIDGSLIVNSNTSNSMVMNISGGTVETDAWTYPNSVGTLKINITSTGILIVDGNQTAILSWMQSQGILNPSAIWNYNITHSGKTTVVFNDTINAAGNWQFRRDEYSVGNTNEWWKDAFNGDAILLPGTVSQRGKGFQNTNITYRRGVSEENFYWGDAWYQNQIASPSDWSGKRILLYMERTKASAVFVGNSGVGWRNSLGTSHIYDITGYVTTGSSNRLTVKVDNKNYPSGIQGGFQLNLVNWNGILGDIELRATDKVYIDKVFVTPDVGSNEVDLIIRIGNSTGSNAQGTIKLTAINSSHSFDAKTISYNVPDGGSEISTTLITNGTPVLWDEFSKNLYTLTANLNDPNGGHNYKYVTKFGMREFVRDAEKIKINGRQVFLRGKHECVPNPISGYYSMDVNDWINVYNKAKQYGINHYRFHTCVPPKAAFEAADQVGIYIQPELYNFSPATFTDDMEAYFKDEGKRVLEEYWNHPSFVMFSGGNEILGNNTKKAAIITYLRNIDPSRLYTEGSDNDFDNPSPPAGSDYWTIIRTGN